MAVRVTTNRESGRTLVATLQKISDAGVLGDYWSEGAGAWQAAPTFANKKITLTEGTSENLGSYSGANTGALGDAGRVLVRIHDDAHASDITINVGEVYIRSGDEVVIDFSANTIQSRLPSALVGGKMDSSVQAMATNIIGADQLADSAITELQTGLSTLDAAGVRSAVGLAAANLDTQLSAIDDFLDTEIAAIKAKTDNLPASPAAVGSAMTLTTAERDAVAAALLDLAAGVETNRTLRQALRLMLAALAGKLSGAATTTVAIRDTNDTKDRITATVDADGNRSAVTLDGT